MSQSKNTTTKKVTLKISVNGKQHTWSIPPGSHVSFPTNAAIANVLSAECLAQGLTVVTAHPEDT